MLLSCPQTAFWFSTMFSCRNSTYVLLFLIFFFLSNQISGFSTPCQIRASSRNVLCFKSCTSSSANLNHPQRPKLRYFTRRVSVSVQVPGADDVSSDKQEDGRADVSSKLYVIFGIFSAIAWILVWVVIFINAEAFSYAELIYPKFLHSSVTALSFHPDPKFADCTFRHNVLTMSQAFAFPLPVGWAAVSVALSSKSSNAGRINLAIAFGSLWLASSWIFAPTFAFGYDLYTWNLKVGAALVHAITATLALFSWKRIISTNVSSPLGYMPRIIRGLVGSLWTLGPSKPSDDPDSPHLTGNDNASIWSLCTVGFLCFAILPIVSPYPLATVPTILGKRLSRPASAFTFLASVCSYCLKDASDRGIGNSPEIMRIRRGLLVGSFTHLTLLTLKLVGVDGGGFILPGRGLWEVYPAMLAVPFATLSSMVLHLLVCFAACPCWCLLFNDFWFIWLIMMPCWDETDWIKECWFQNYKILKDYCY